MLTLFQIVLFPTIYAQKSIIPPSPIASSLGKYGDIPVGTYTGTPQIALPIGEAKGKQLSVPVSLSYHASGVKVDDIASQVGLGWSLNAGGVITRTIKGLPDEGNWGYANYNFDPNSNENRKSALSNLIDTEPDVFFFNVNGYSGKFYLDFVNNAKVVRLIPYQDIDIKFIEDSNGTRWVLTTPDGTKYYFNTTESTDTNLEKSTPDTYVTSWYLTKAESITGDLATFSYKTGDILTYRPAISETFTTPATTNSDDCYRSLSASLSTTNYQIGPNLYLESTAFSFTPAAGVIGNSPNLTANSPNFKSNQTLIDEINTFHNKIKFAYSNPMDRQDLAAGALALKSVTISNKNYSDNTFVPVKRIDIGYDYFVSNEGGAPFNDSRNLYRLKLTKLTETGIGSDGKETSLPPHELEYYEDANSNLPPRLSTKQDHWGYANNNDANSLIPRSLNNPRLYNRGDRSPSALRCLAGTIRKIKYPTGGYTEFEFEPHSTVNTPELLALSTPQFVRSNESAIADFSYTNSPNTNSIIIDVPVDQIVDITYSLTLGTANTNPQIHPLPIADYDGYVKIDKIDGDVTSTVFTMGDPLNGNYPSSNTIQTTTRSLSAGKYKLTAYAKKQEIGLPERSVITVGYTKLVNPSLGLTPPVNGLIGGVRIRRIKSYENANSQPIVKRYEYNMFDDGTKSSGQLISLPVYNYDVTMALLGYNHIMSVTSPTGFLDIPYETGQLCAIHAIASASKVPLGTSQGGSHVVYTNVSVFNGENGEGGKSDITYSYFPDALNNFLPFAQHDSYDWLRGNIEKQVDYNKINNVYVETKRQTNSYTYKKNGIDTRYFYTRTGYVVAPKYPNAVTIPKDVIGITKINQYNIFAPWVSLQSTTTIQDGVTTTTTYDYDEAHSYHTQPLATHTWNSYGQELKTTILYTKDTPLSTDPAIKACNDLNILTPLEQRVTYNSVFQGGTKTKFEVLSINGKSIPLATQDIRILRDNTELTYSTMTYFPSDGFVQTITQKGFSVPKSYTWDNGRVKTQTFGSLTTKLDYKPNSTLVETLTDENGLMKRFSYDPFFRLTTIQDRFQTDANNNPVSSTVQAKTNFTYHYQGQPTDIPADINRNYVLTKTYFLNAADTTPLSIRQYIDGLGRPNEIVKEYYTPKVDPHPNVGWHQKNYMTYDVLGRQSQSFLPFESGTLGFEVASNQFAKIEYEASPLSRPLIQTNVDGTTIQSSYGTNSGTDTRVFKVSSTGVISAIDFYPQGTLYKTTMTDENSKQTMVFKDKIGRVILTRKFLGQTWVETYNVYDDYGQLVAVLPPGSVDTTGKIALSLIFQYQYDIKNRLMMKKVPGADSLTFYYDSRDLMVLTQDGNMRTPNASKHLATIYDELGRVKKTGFVNVSSTPGQDISVAESQITDLLTETQYYAGKNWVKHQGAKVLNPSGVSSLRSFLWSYIERRDGYTYSGNPIWTARQHLMSLTGSGDNGNKTIGDSDQDGVDWHVSNYDGAQKPLLTLRYLYPGSPASQVRSYETYTYDNGQRLTDTKYLYTLYGAGLSVPTYTLSNLTYNFKDQLIEKNIGYNATTGKALQSIDYAYNLRGWLTGINTLNNYGISNTSILTPGSVGSGTIQNLMVSPWIKAAMQDFTAPYKGANALELSPVNDNNGDLFSEKIDYNAPNTGFGVFGQNNGNISAVTWQVAGRDKQGYGFKYDDLDRLLESNYFDITDTYKGTTSSWYSTFSTDNKFMEKPTYDLRGNITSLKRNGLNAGAWTTNGYTAATYGMIDNLSYAYGDSNRLMRVMESSLKDKGFKSVDNAYDRQYSYDRNGNLTADRNKGITNIIYNYLNLPQEIIFTGGRVIKFVYDASGAKLKKYTINGTVKDSTDYINGVEYKGSILQRIAHTEGAVVRNQYGYYDHEYVLRDHLGNIRVTFKDGESKGDAYFDWNTYTMKDPNAGNAGYNDGVITQSDIKTINNFYPFGMDMEGNWNGSFDAASNRFKYNGKEFNNDFGLGWYDYGARYYTGDLGRWWSIDPSTEKYVNWTPYNYCMNNPIKMIDPNGKDNILYIIFINRGQDKNINRGEIVKMVNYVFNLNNINAKAIGIDYDGTKPLDIGNLDASDMVAYIGKGSIINNMKIPREQLCDFFQHDLSQNHRGNADAASGGRVSTVNTDAYFGSNVYGVSMDDDKYNEMYGEGFGISTNIARTISHETGHNALGDGIHPDESFNDWDAPRYKGMTGYDLINRTSLMTSGSALSRQPLAQDPNSLLALPVDAQNIQKRFPASHTPKDNWSGPMGLKTIKE